MPFSDVLRRRVLDLPFACAAVAVAVRAAASWQAFASNPLVFRPQLDALFYASWALDIAGGDLVGHGGAIGGEPLFLNPLYAYVLAPFAFAFGQGLIPWVLGFQAVLGGATAALSAVTARRLFGRIAGVVAGLGVALSTALVHLDTHLSVSGLSAFLVAGAAFCASRPARDPDALRGAHGPIVAGIWLGLGALARPITPLVLPVHAWLLARRASPGRRRVIAAAVVAVFFVPAGFSLARNVAVSGEWALYTAASGANIYLGNSRAARVYRTMSSGGRFRFNPFQMHVDARRDMTPRLGPDATWGEISTAFRDDALAEMATEPAASAAFLVHKARWFATPVEVPSSANLEIDRGFAPLLRLAVVPSWLLVALGGVALVLFARRRDVLLGVGSLAVAHLAVLTLVFPLSHYRSPALPAIAVLAGGAVQWFAAAWCARRWRAAAAALVGVAGVVALGALPPQPTTLHHTGWFTLATCYQDMGDLDAAEAAAVRGHELYRADWPGEPDLPAYWVVLGYVHSVRDADWARAAEDYRRAIAVEPGDWQAWLTVVEMERRQANLGAALAELDALVRHDPALERHPAVLSRYVEVLFQMGEKAESRRIFEVLLDLPRTGPGDRPREFAIPPDLRGR